MPSPVPESRVDRGTPWGSSPTGSSFSFSAKGTITSAKRFLGRRYDGLPVRPVGPASAPRLCSDALQGVDEAAEQPGLLLIASQLDEVRGDVGNLDVASLAVGNQ
ncbi:MAG: hypothetical protein JWO49_1983 [Arthrobacter sp.]|nr:hypothetical protein [Arthrobacter sp.]